MTSINKSVADTRSLREAVMRFLQGILIGVGAVLPGISGGVLCVVFGLYQTIMGFLTHPFETLKQEYRTLIPVIMGGGFGFVVVAKILGILLEAYPNPSVCLFVGLIAGMTPSLFKEAGKEGTDKTSFISFAIGFFVILAVLISLQKIQMQVTPNILWYLFCGFCIALSVIAPGMSFSTLLMPLGLYTPLVTGIGNFDFGVIVPSGIGALVTILVLSKTVEYWMKTQYNAMFHGIIGVVMAATIVIIPFSSFTESPSSCAVNLVCIAVGVVIALGLDAINRTVEVPEE